MTEAGSADAGGEGPDGGAEGEVEAVDSGAAEDKPAQVGTAKTGKAKTGRKAKAEAARPRRPSKGGPACADSEQGAQADYAGAAPR